jgi:hypothetical protein
MPSEKAVSLGITEFKYRENQLGVCLTEVHDPAIRVLVKCIGTNAGRFANCPRHYQIVPRVGRGYLVVRHVPGRESERLFAAQSP